MHTFAREAPLLAIDLAVGLLGFGLSILWGRATQKEMGLGTVRLLAFAWAGIALFGMILAFAI